MDNLVKTFSWIFLLKHFFISKGLGDHENRNKPVSLMKDQQIKLVAVGQFHSFIYKETGELYSFGRNVYLFYYMIWIFLTLLIFKHLKDSGNLGKKNHSQKI